MDCVARLIYFSKEFLLDRSFEDITEKVISNLQEESLAIIGVVNETYEKFFDNLPIGDEDAKKFIKLHQDLVRDLKYLQDLSLRQKKGLKWHFNSSTKSNIDEENLDQNSVNSNFEILKSLLMKLECQALDYQSAMGESSVTNSSTSFAPVLSKSFYECMVKNYSRLNKNLLCKNVDENIGSASKEQLDVIRLHLTNLQKSSMFQSLRKIVVSKKKFVKTLSEIASICVHLPGDKIMSPRPRSFALKESESSYSHSHHTCFQLMNLFPESIVFSEPCSKVRPKKASLSLDSLSLILPQLLEENESITNKRNDYHISDLNGNGINREDRPCWDGHCELKMIKVKSPRHRSEFESTAGKCHCFIF